jgi:large subunit ribosomal protein L4e
MAAARPQVTIFNVADGESSRRTVALPAVFTAPIRTDVVQFVHMNMSKNRRQAYAVYKETGEIVLPPSIIHSLLSSIHQTSPSSSPR